MRATMIAPAAAVFAVVALLAGCGGSSAEQGSEAMTATTGTNTAAPEATTVAKELKAQGVAISYPVTELDTSEDLGPGMQSTVATATNHSDIKIEVYDSAEHRNDARLALIDLPGKPPVFVAQCGPILVYIPEVESDAAPQRQERKKIQGALEASYGPC